MPGNPSDVGAYGDIMIVVVVVVADQALNFYIGLPQEMQGYVARLSAVSVGSALNAVLANPAFLRNGVAAQMPQQTDWVARSRAQLPWLHLNVSTFLYSTFSCHGMYYISLGDKPNCLKLRHLSPGILNLGT